MNDQDQEAIDAILAGMASLNFRRASSLEEFEMLAASGVAARYAEVDAHGISERSTMTEFETKFLTRLLMEHMKASYR